jgi:hypothetical protein
MPGDDCTSNFGDSSSSRTPGIADVCGSDEPSLFVRLSAGSRQFSGRERCRVMPMTRGKAKASMKPINEIPTTAESPPKARTQGESVILFGNAIDEFQRARRCACAAATLTRSLLIDRCPCRLGYLCKPSGMQVKIWIHWFSRSTHVAVTSAGVFTVMWVSALVRASPSKRRHANVPRFAGIVELSLPQRV